ncbi:hypothetical protein PM082_014853 [Marasmius tenuissimus]|nr:hypothetical protein PM082_014853 [Marasmius tenuissimus]
MNAIFTYDGMKNDGFSLREGKGGVGQLLAGANPQKIPNGYVTASVFYTLKGGSAAQNWVWNHQAALLKKHAGIEVNQSHSTARNESLRFPKPGYTEVPPDDQLWLSSDAITRLKARVNPFKEYEAQSKLGGNRDSLSFGLENSGVGEETESFLSMDQPPSSSPQTSLVPFQCRCGETEDGDHQNIKQQAVQCELCCTWHHVACQLGGGALLPEVFQCHMCVGTPAFWGNWKKRFYSEWPVNTKETQPLSSLISRLSRGYTILVEDGRFYYPARLIEPLSEPITLETEVLVKYWRGNLPSDDALHKPGSYSTAKVKILGDALANSVSDRRGTRLGTWTTTRETYQEQNEREEGETPQNSAKFTTDIRRRLDPHIDELHALIHNPKAQSPAQYPTIQYQINTKRTVVPLTGGLPALLRSQIKNYVYNMVPGVKDLKKHTWVTDGPLQEAFIRYIASRDEAEFLALEGCPRRGKKRTQHVQKCAWERLVAYTGKTQDGRDLAPVEDVDYQSLALLEDRMFDPKFNPGVAGNQQWGLDIGIHQDAWDLYVHFPDDRGKIYHTWDNDEVGPKFNLDGYTIAWRKQEESKKVKQRETESTLATRLRPLPQRRVPKQTS